MLILPLGTINPCVCASQVIDMKLKNIILDLRSESLQRRLAHKSDHALAHEHVHKRTGGWFYYRRRVPDFVKHLDPRLEVKIALKTKDESEARRKGAIYHDYIEEFWRALIKSGNAAGVEDRYKAALQLAKAHGFAYRTATELARNAPTDELLARLELVNNEAQARALLGGAPRPKVTLESVKEKYFDLAVDIKSGKSERWQRKWRNDRTNAINGMIEVLGNRAIEGLTRTDILTFVDWWRGRISEGMSGDTANTCVRYCREMIQTVANAYEVEVDYDKMFEKTRFSVKINSRPPFDASFVQNNILPGLEGLGPDHRLFVYAMADTGARPIELVRLYDNWKENVRLDADIPFIWVRGETKTQSSIRQIPLVGAALYAFKMRPRGFEKWTNADSISSHVNAYFTENNLRPTEEHSLYSLRHTFKDRLRDVETPDEIIDELMGHADDGPKYGRGHLLEKKHKWLKKIAFKV